MFSINAIKNKVNEVVSTVSERANKVKETALLTRNGYLIGLYAGRRGASPSDVSAFLTEFILKESVPEAIVVTGIIIDDGKYYVEDLNLPYSWAIGDTIEAATRQVNRYRHWIEELVEIRVHQIRAESKENAEISEATISSLEDNGLADVFRALAAEMEINNE